MSVVSLRRRVTVGTLGAVLALALPLGLTATDAGAATASRGATATAQVAVKAAAKTASKPKSAHAIAHSMMRTKRYHWTSTKQWSCLKTLWNRESGWRVHAGAAKGPYGIPQAMPGSKMGRGWRDSAHTQIKWGLTYIKGRYSTPCGATHHQNVHGWY